MLSRCARQETGPKASPAAHIKPPAGAGAPAGEEGRCSRPGGREQREEGGIYLPKWKSPFFS